MGRNTQMLAPLPSSAIGWGSPRRKYDLDLNGLADPEVASCPSGQQLL